MKKSMFQRQRTQNTSYSLKYKESCLLLSANERIKEQKILFTSRDFTFCVTKMRVVTQLQGSTKNLIRNISPLGRNRWCTELLTLDRHCEYDYSVTTITNLTFQSSAKQAFPWCLSSKLRQTWENSSSISAKEIK